MIRQTYRAQSALIAEEDEMTTKGSWLYVLSPVSWARIIRLVYLVAWG